MFEDFERYICSKADFTVSELQQMQLLSTIKYLRKRDLLLHEGELCRHKTFVTHGLLRTYSVKEDGTEHTMRFAPENTWIIDHESYSQQIPSKYYMEALEDSEVIQWSKEDSNSLMNTIPAFKLFSERLKEQSINYSQQRILTNISYTAEEKYQEFVNSFPDILNRVPLHMVAGYIGVSRETLSRIRHAQVVKRKNVANRVAL